MPYTPSYESRVQTYHQERWNRFYVEREKAQWNQYQDQRREKHQEYQKSFRQYEEWRKTLPEIQKSMQNSMQGKNYSMLNHYANSVEIERVDLQAYKFLVLRKNEFREASVLCSIPVLSKLKIKKEQILLLPAFGVISGMVLSMLAESVSGLFISMGSIFYTMPKSNHLIEQKIDDIAIKKADVEELKGGRRFFKACQKILPVKQQEIDSNKGSFYKLFISPSSSFFGFDSTSSDESWLPSLALNPSWKERITKIEKELQSRGEDISVTEEDQQKIVLLEEVV